MLMMMLPTHTSLSLPVTTPSSSNSCSQSLTISSNSCWLLTVSNRSSWASSSSASIESCLAENTFGEKDDAQLGLPDTITNQQEFDGVVNDWQQEFDDVVDDWLQPVSALAYAQVCSSPHQPETATSRSLCMQATQRTANHRISVMV